MSRLPRNYVLAAAGALCATLLVFLILKWQNDERQSPLSWNESNLKLDCESFGKLTFGFRFTNPSIHTYYVERWTTSCGCTVASMSSTIIHPGESGVLSGVFDPEAQTGLQRKTIILEYYDEANRSHIDTLTADIQIKDVIAIAPPVLQLPLTSDSQAGTLVVTPLVNNVADMLFESTHSLIDGRVVPPVNGANSYKVEVSVQKGFSGTKQCLLIVKLLDGSKKIYNLLIAVGNK